MVRQARRQGSGVTYLVLIGFVVGVPALICAIAYLAVLADEMDREQEARERHPAGRDL